MAAMNVGGQDARSQSDPAPRLQRGRHTLEHLDPVDNILKRDGVDRAVLDCVGECFELQAFGRCARIGPNFLHTLDRLVLS